ncbi:MAG TPA: type I-C CRISPR-associated protein Cas5c [Candidatus Paceibacterota bacterium]|nr:type I-C CRISPR-associated protein Cas5c [Candidatus Paceibacterota bacterium]HRZ56165.1 type I-C CRISPR-associated protein Cas5c [Candidatus Paceibacterota bacterium]
MKPNLITLRVWGDFACFTRPEMKVERVSYPVITPSAARGVLEAVFWEPQMFYLIDAVRVVKKGRWFSFRRNEVIKVISLDSARTWMREPQKTTPIQAGGGADDGTQRNMLALQDVEYLITAEVRTTPLAGRPEDRLQKYLDEIERRARQGKCFHRPALGVREFAADFEWVEGEPDGTLARRAAENGQAPEQFNEDLGLMLYDVFDHREREAGFRWLRDGEISSLQSPDSHSSKARRPKKPAEVPRWRGRLIQPQPAFFRARIEKSKLDCHPDRVRILTSTPGGN